MVDLKNMFNASELFSNGQSFGTFK